MTGESQEIKIREAREEIERQAMHKLLAAAGWDADSIRHQQLQNALNGSGLAIVPRSLLEWWEEQYPKHKE